MGQDLSRDSGSDGSPLRNCWEVTACGREPGGERVDELGVCPAATCAEADGANGGRFGGRICWSIAGTLCGGRVQGSRAAKILSCVMCPFFDQVVQEQGGGFFLHLRDWLRIAGRRRA